jgi:hypothetical protein
MCTLQRIADRGKTDDGIRATRSKNLKSHYGISRERYDKLLASQGGVCAACGNPPGDPAGKRFHNLEVDHCHSSLEIRALLCWRCNITIGHFMESVDAVESAIEHLEQCSH